MLGRAAAQPQGRLEPSSDRQVGSRAVERSPQHQALTGKFAALKERLASEGPTREFSSSVTLFMTGWLLEHISGMDRAIGRFMKEREKSL